MLILQAYGRKATLDSARKQKNGWTATLLRKAAQPMLLSRFAGHAGREVDDLAAQFFRHPLFVGQLKVCWNVKLNQFRHHILLLAADPALLGSVLQEPPQKSESNQAQPDVLYLWF
jgi:hypothetical protein